MEKVLTIKKNMTQRFDADGICTPVTSLLVVDGMLGKLKEGIKVKVQGVSKGKGFSGVVKRWGFAGGPATHGSKWNRRTGSIGAGTTPGRVVKGKKMPGRYGNKVVTVRGLKIIHINTDNNLIEVKGAVPGSRNSKVTVFIEEEG